MINMESAEQHPLKPFLPQNARILMLGSFPPPKARWSIDFFYPNFQNDMWRIMGLVFHSDKNHFVKTDERKFDYREIVDFCTNKGIAIFDTASAVHRLNNNASDKFLEVVTPTDISALLERIPQCTAIVTTGEKATCTIVERYGCKMPKVGQSVKLTIGYKEYDFFRMPSSSRAYPLALDKKASAYKTMFEKVF